MIEMITLGALAALVIFGLAKLVLKDFKIGGIFAVLFLGAVIGLNFIPVITLGGVFSFSVGTALFYVLGIAALFFFGRFITQMTALSITIMLGGLSYAATRLAVMGMGGFFADTNFVYAILIGFFAFLFTRNGKYIFAVSAGSMLILNMLVQIGQPAVNLNHGFAWTCISLATGSVLYAVTARLTLKPSKLSYYFEIGRLKD